MSDVHAAQSSQAEPAANGDAGGNADIENRARAQGWRPKDEFRGPAERWVDATKFIEAAESFLPVAVERNRKLEDAVTRSQAELSSVRTELGEVKQVLTDFREFASRGEQRAYERAMADLKAKQKVAVAHADTDAYDQTQAEIDELAKSAPKSSTVERKTPDVPRETVAAPDPVVTGWITDNPWFNTDSELHAYAKAQDRFFAEAQPGLSMADRLSRVKQRVQREYPEKFGNARREEPSAVAQPSGGTSRRAAEKHSYDNLPPDAKKACDKFVKTIPGFKRDDYVRDFDWSE